MLTDIENFFLIILILPLVQSKFLHLTCYLSSNSKTANIEIEFFNSPKERKIQKYFYTQVVPNLNDSSNHVTCQRQECCYFAKPVVPKLVTGASSTTHIYTLLH